MSIKKQKLYSEIETLPEKFTNQVIEYLDKETPENVTIKSKKDLKEKLQKGLDDIKANKVYFLDEIFSELENI